MKLQIISSLAFSAVYLTSVCAASAAEEGFQSIFNGKDLTGWDGNPKLWSVKDGAIVGQTTAENPLKGNTFLIWTDGTTADFELRCSYKITPNNDKEFANSGIQYRSKVFDPAGWVVGGYQADLEAGPTYSGILYEERMTRGIMAARGEKVVWDKDCKKQVTGSVGKSEEIQAAIKKDDWNDYVIVAKGNHLQHFINGKPTVDVTDECEAKAAKSGVLALQVHAGQPMTVAFKALRIKNLSGTARSSEDDLKKLQGAWKILRGEANGTAMPADDIAAITVTIKDKSYKVTNPDELDQGTFTVDATKQPGQMDIQTAAGRAMKAIYEFGADSLRICYATEGGARPAAFATSAESGTVLFTYERKKD